MKKNDTLQTPEWVYKPLGDFFLDPCAGVNTKIAQHNWAIERGEDGLLNDWIWRDLKVFVWCNPPFSQKEQWIEKMIRHDFGIMILPERGSTPWFGPLAAHCGAYFVMGKKINFIGGPSSNPLGSVLFPFGEEAKKRILKSNLPGHFVEVVKFTKR